VDDLVGNVLVADGVEGRFVIESVGSDGLSLTLDRPFAKSNSTQSFRIQTLAQTGATYYGLTASGTASLQGITGLTLEGALALQTNSGPDGVVIDFERSEASLPEGVDFSVAPTDYLKLSGNLTFSLDERVEVEGRFDITLDDEKMLIGGSGLKAELDVNGRSAGIYDGEIGLVIPKAGGWAVSASGIAQAELLEGISLIVPASIEMNRTGTAVDETIMVGGTTVTIEFADGAKFITNSHRAAKQIWLAAGSSAWHFDHTERGWIATREGRELGAVLAEALARKVGRPFELRVPQ